MMGGSHMSFSPDSTRIMDVVGHKVLWVSPANGGKPEKVYEFPDPDVRIDYPVWSPDGKKIAFGRNADDEQRDIYTVNADGSGLFQVTHTPNISEFNGDWGTHPVTP